MSYPSVQIWTLRYSAKTCAESSNHGAMIPQLPASGSYPGGTDRKRRAIESLFATTRT